MDVYVVEDDPTVRKSVRSLLESVNLTVRTFNSGQEVLTGYDPQGCCCMIVDLRLSDISGLQVIQEIQNRKLYCPPVIVVTGFGDVTTAVRAMKMGVVNFLEKPFPPQQLLEEVQKAIETDGKLRQSYQRRQALAQALKGLSQRERDVLNALMAGKANKQIAIDLSLSDKTVSWHRANILEKLSAPSLVNLAREMHELGEKA